MERLPAQKKRILWGLVTLLVLSGSWFAVRLLWEWMPYDQAWVSRFAYLRDSLFVGVVGATATVVAAVLFDHRRWFVAGLTLALGLFLVFDPYSFGLRGGDWNLQAEFMWQRSATLVLAILLAGALLSLKYGRIKVYLVLLIAEALGFLWVNAAYIERDGLSLRGHFGYDGAPLPGLLMGAGIIVRCTVILLVLRNHAIRRAMPSEETRF